MIFILKKYVEKNVNKTKVVERPMLSWMQKCVFTALCVSSGMK